MEEPPDADAETSQDKATESGVPRNQDTQYLMVGVGGTAMLLAGAEVSAGLVLNLDNPVNLPDRYFSFGMRAGMEASAGFGVETLYTTAPEGPSTVVGVTAPLSVDRIYSKQYESEYWPGEGNFSMDEPTGWRLSLGRSIGYGVHQVDSKTWTTIPEESPDVVEDPDDDVVTNDSTEYP
jgi:hypothetical protein